MAGLVPGTPWPTPPFDRQRHTLPAPVGRAELPVAKAHVLGANLQRLSADWQAEWGPPLELAESFLDRS